MQTAKTDYLNYGYSRERGTAQWLQNEYGGNLPAFTVAKGDLFLELLWAQMQQHIGQPVAEDKFFTGADNDSLAYVDFEDLKEQMQSQEASLCVWHGLSTM